MHGPIPPRHIPDINVIFLAHRHPMSFQTEYRPLWFDIMYCKAKTEHIISIYSDTAEFYSLIRSHFLNCITFGIQKGQYDLLYISTIIEVRDNCVSETLFRLCIRRAQRQNYSLNCFVNIVSTAILSNRELVCKLHGLIVLRQVSNKGRRMTVTFSFPHVTYGGIIKYILQHTLYGQVADKVFLSMQVSHN